MGRRHEERLDRARAWITGLAEARLPWHDAAAEIIARLRTVVGFDAYCLSLNDPRTAMPSACSADNDVVGSRQGVFWRIEMQQPDVNKTAELATRPCPVAALGLATGDDPARSLRWSELLATGGVGDELRAGLVADGTWWGCLALYRARDSAPFSGEDVSAVAGLVHPIAKAIRSTWTERSPAPSGVDEPPGSLVVTAEGRVVTATASADHWLGSLDATLRDSGTLVHALVARLGDTIGPYRPAEAAHTLVRGVDGAWLELHACPLGSSVGGGEIAITVQAAKPATVRELLLRAYGLTPRERQVADLVLAGRTTPDIGTALFLSPHTVGDHLKAIFAKTGVHTRTELAHRLAGRSH